MSKSSSQNSPNSLGSNGSSLGSDSGSPGSLQLSFSDSPYEKTPTINHELKHLDKAVYEKIAKMEVSQVFDPDCVRKKSNWSAPVAGLLLDDPDFNPSVIIEHMHNMSPKLEKLLKVITMLDGRDMQRDGHKYKHFIFTDLKSGPHGAKLLASALIAKGMKCGYAVQPTKGKKKFTKIEMVSEEKVLEDPGNTFHVLVSGSIYDQTLGVAFKKEVLKNFNSRPDNVYGDLSRIIIMDSGFKEGIDLFDVKYVHIFEPQSSPADQKQVIGRATRTCGQKGLLFHPTNGWPLHVFNYDLVMPGALSKGFANKDTGLALYLHALGVDLRLINFTAELEEIAMHGAVDYELNKNIHEFSIGNGDSSIVGGANCITAYNADSLFLNRSEITHDTMKSFINKNFKDYAWNDVKMENLCGYAGPETQTGGATIMKYTPTQAFIKNYFRPENPIKGMLLYHSVGTGKTCSAIASASYAFERQGYTILWVTRTTLKNDIWKNMFDQVCSDTIREKIELGAQIPDENAKRMRLLSKSWSIRPMSYKQFSNMITGGNSFYKALVKKNGTEDPLRKTLLIIDEAHKLYGGADLSSIERPDMDVFARAIYNSHIVSGENSVKLLLMTATPITNDPMELIKLVNLCKPMEQKIPDHFETFSQLYLDETGKFHNAGEKKFLDQIAGHISYLNREKDARQFSQPIIRNVPVPIVDREMNTIALSASRRLVKDIELDKIKNLQTEVDDNLKAISGDFSDLDRNRFKHLYKECDGLEGKEEKTCKKVVNAHIRDIIAEARSYMKEAKTKVKVIREMIRDIRSELKGVVEQAGITFQDLPLEKMDNLAKSPLYNIIHICRKNIKSLKELDEQVQKDPLIIELDNKIDVMENAIRELREQEKIRVQGVNKYIKYLTKMLKTGDLNENEEMLIKKLIIEAKDNNKTQKVEVNYHIGTQRKVVVKKTKAIRKLKKKYTRKVMKAFKNENRKIKGIDNEIAKNEKKLLRELRKTEEIQEEFKNEQLKEIVGNHEQQIKQALEEAHEAEVRAIAEKEAEKQAKLEAKEAEKKAKLEAKEAEKKAKQDAKEAEKRAKQEAKEAEKKAKQEAKKNAKK